MEYIQYVKRLSGKYPATCVFDALEQRFLHTKVTNHVRVEHLPVHVVAFSRQVYGKPVRPVQLRALRYRWIASFHMQREMEDYQGNLHAKA